jgi:hypothetical protein
VTEDLLGGDGLVAGIRLRAEVGTVEFGESEEEVGGGLLDESELAAVVIG